MKLILQRSLSSVNTRQWHGNVRRLSQKFESLSEIKPESSDQLSILKSQLFSTGHPFFVEEQRGYQSRRSCTRISTVRSGAVSVYNTNANVVISNESSTSLFDDLWNFLANEQSLRVFKQIFVGSCAGICVGSLLEQRSYTTKFVGAVTTGLLIGEYIVNFVQWTSLQFSSSELGVSKVSYSNLLRILKNLDGLITNNIPTIVSFLFASIISSSIKVNSNDHSSDPVSVYRQLPPLMEQNISAMEFLIAAPLITLIHCRL